jgi:hypothetical protein
MLADLLMRILDSLHAISSQLVRGCSWPRMVSLQSPCRAVVDRARWCRLRVSGRCPVLSSWELRPADRLHAIQPTCAALALTSPTVLPPSVRAIGNQARDPGGLGPTAACYSYGLTYPFLCIQVSLPEGITDVKHFGCSASSLRVTFA